MVTGHPEVGGQPVEPQRVRPKTVSTTQRQDDLFVYKKGERAAREKNAHDGEKVVTYPLHPPFPTHDYKLFQKQIYSRNRPNCCPVVCFTRSLICFKF